MKKETQKIDLVKCDFTLTKILSKMLVLITDFNKLDNDIKYNNENVKKYIKNKVKENFIYNETSLKYVELNLGLFLFGNKNNFFDKTLLNEKNY